MSTRASTDEGRRRSTIGIATKREAFGVFWLWSSPRVVAAGTLAVAVLRAIVGRWSGWDLYAVAIVLFLTPFTEWTIHLKLLHGEPKSYFGGAVNVGLGHREHHLNPTEIGWLLLGGYDAAAFQALIAGSVLAVALPLPLFVGGPLLGTGLSAVLAAQFKLLEYEWAHFFFHTAYRPRTRWYQNRQKNHRRHHYRNENYWLGITNNFGDRVMRTLPKNKSDVPWTKTARTLDGVAKD